MHLLAWGVRILCDCAPFAVAHGPHNNKGGDLTDNLASIGLRKLAADRSGLVPLLLLPLYLQDNTFFLQFNLNQCLCGSRNKINVVVLQANIAGERVCVEETSTQDGR